MVRRPPAIEAGRAVAAWRRHLKRDYADLTAGVYLGHWRKFAAWCEAKRIPILVAKRADVAAWRDEMAGSYAARTIALRLAAVRSFYAWAIEHGAPIDNPAAGLRIKGRPPARVRRRDELTDDEVRAVLGTCYLDPIGRRDRAIVCLMAYCALRTVEVQRADVGDLEAREGRSILWVWGKGRSGPDEYVVLPAPAEAAIREWMAVRPGEGGPLFVSLREPGRRLSLAFLRRMIKGRYYKAGIVSDRKTSHSLRHSAISNAIRHGATPLQAQAMARHSDVRSTLIYYHEHGRMAAPAEDRIDYGESVEGGNDGKG